MEMRQPERAIAPSALEAICTHDWPGNVRALRHACERAVILSDSGQYRYADFGLQGIVAPAPVPVQAPVDAPIETLRLNTLERDAVGAALEQVKGNISRAAKLLGVSRAALYRKLDKHGL